MRKILIGTIAALFFSATASAQLADLSGGQTGRIEFASITSPDRWTYLRAYTQNFKPVVAFGDLLMPKTDGDLKVPAVVLVHGSGGVEASNYDVWGKALNTAGYAVFIIDTYKPRGINDTVSNQNTIELSSQIADAHNALRMLSTHPRVDPKRISLKGFSRGGQVTFEAYFDAARRPIIPDASTTRFNAFIPVYQGCGIRVRGDRGNTNNTPMLALHGSKDDSHDVVAPAKFKPHPQARST